MFIVYLFSPLVPSRGGWCKPGVRLGFVWFYWRSGSVEKFSGITLMNYVKPVRKFVRRCSLEVNSYPIRLTYKCNIIIIFIHCNSYLCWVSDSLHHKLRTMWFRYFIYFFFILFYLFIHFICLKSCEAINPFIF